MTPLALTAPGLRDWPPLGRLSRLASYLDRMARLPRGAGPAGLAALRDDLLPLPATWPEDCAPGALPDCAERGWLATAWRMRPAEESPQERLLHIARETRTRPGWTLATLWLLESALGWPGWAPPEVYGALLGEAGDLHCQTGDLVQGVEMLDAGASALVMSGSPEACAFARELSFRAARWIARLNEGGETARLKQLVDPAQSAPPGVRQAAELELLARSVGRRPETTALFESVRRVEALLAGDGRLSRGERSRLRARADHLIGRWMSASHSRQVREKGREHLAESLAASTKAEDFVAKAHTLDALGRASLRQGDIAGARERFEEAADLMGRLRDPWGLGVALTGLAECRLAVGQARDSLPFFEANLYLCDCLPGLEVLFVRHFARHLNALVAAECNPLDTTAPDARTLQVAKELLDRYTQLVRAPAEDPFCHLLGGNYHRLAARGKADPQERLLLLEEGIRNVDDARARFERGGDRRHAAEARRALAALWLDRAALEGDEDLPAAKACLEEAEQATRDARALYETELLWARYHQMAKAPYRMQMHLAAARRAAEAAGLGAFTLEVDARLGVTLTGPCSGPVVLPLGEPTELLVQAEDWRGRPLPSFALQAVLEVTEGALDVAPALARTDGQGRARFFLTAHAPSQATLRIGTPDGLHSLAAEIVARRTDFEPPGALRPEDEAVLRQLFGRDCPRVRVMRAFSSGHSGARVLLIEPFRDGDGGELRGQPCIVKLGPRAVLADEEARYTRWVKELLPLNVSRLDGSASWHDRVALRFSLVGEGRGGALSQSEVREAGEWLASSPPFEAHLLVERVFAGDLAACWYGNGPRRKPPTAVAELYAPFLPTLLHLDEAGPGLGLTGAAGTEGPSPAEGLRSPSTRSFRPGEVVSPSPGRLTRFRPSGDRWEYTFVAPSPPLRYTLRSSLAPDLLEPDGVPERLLSSPAPWRVTGHASDTVFDRAEAILGRCVDVYRQARPREEVALDGDELRIAGRRLPSPLPRLASLLSRQVPCHWSLIHGDMHGRNVLVSPRGDPFYIDFAWTGYGPTLFDFLKFEAYLWHENFTEPGLPEALTLLEDFAGPDAAKQFPSPYQRSDAPALAGFRQCLATLRSAARPYVLAPRAEDYFVPLALYTGLMIRWCDPDEARATAERVRRARRGVLHATACAAILAGALGGE